MSRTRRITVKIAGKEYAMTVPQDDEEKYRRAAREINELISAYKGSFVADRRITSRWQPCGWRLTK